MPSKYHARAATVDGHRFASLAEAKRYGELRLLERAGLIRNLVLQPRYPLLVNGEVIGHYVGDFEYIDTAAERVTTEDVKGVLLPVYLWKKKHFQAQYGRPIFEIQR